MRAHEQELKMESDVLDALEALGYKGPLLEEEALSKAVENGLSSPDFSELCVWLSSEIKSVCDLEESITSTAVFLSTELQALQILHSKQLKSSHLEKNNEIYQEVQTLCDSLGLSKPSSSDIPLLLSNVESKIKDILSKVKNTHVGKPLLTTPLNPDQTERLEKINDALRSEYECRRRMLMKRLDVTVQSFGWSDRAKVKTDDIARIYQPKRYALSPKTTITFAHLLAAREDLSKIIRTSSGSTREKTACAINKVLMGRVPDRGGRPTEIEPPPPEMPPWQKRQEGGGRGGWGGGGGGGGGGGFSGGGRGGGGFQGRETMGAGGYSGRGGYGDPYGGRGGGGYRRY